VIDIVIVDYNAGEVLERCLASVERAQHSGAGIGLVCVVVNGEQSEALAQRLARGLIRVERPPVNIGFAAACNLGAAAGTGQHILFLNPDTEISVDALQTAAGYLSKPGNEHIGICGVTLTTPGGAVGRTCSEFPTFSHVLNKALGLGYLSPFHFRTGFMQNWDHRSTRVVDCVMGAFYFVRRGVFARLGGFDERFFVYYEDLDFCRRARDLGFLTLYTHDASIRHVGRATTDRVPAQRLRYLLASRTAYMRKHHGNVAALATWLVSLLIEMPARVTLAVLRGRGVEALAAVEAWASLWNPAPRRESAYRRWGKRAADVISSGLLLLALAPVLVAVAVLVRLRLGSPVLFRQMRPGQAGRPFTIQKFRTMTDARGADGVLLPDEHRLTGFGRLLRRSSLDELPELWNVLRGDMSLVGPRPLLMEYLRRYDPEQCRRHEVRPGITGLAQVAGRNSLGWDERLRLDVSYLDDVSLAADIRILGRTFKTVFTGEGISGAGCATMTEFKGAEPKTVGPRPTEGEPPEAR